MRFGNFQRLTKSKLLNSPSVYSFENIEIEPNRVKRGDLFISDNLDEIELAVEQGAYAIVSSCKNLSIIDSEIAWFKTSSCSDVLIRLLRYNLTKRKLYFIYLNEVELELIQKIADKERLIFLVGDDKDSFKKIINAKEDSILFSSDIDFIESIYPNFKRVPILKENSLLKVTKKSLFLSSFIFRDELYRDIRVSPIFLKNLERVVNFLEDNSIDFDIKKATLNSHFYPIFVDSNLNIRPFGKSDRVLIYESSKNLIDIELNYLKSSAPWAKIISNISDSDKLKGIDFNFAIISITKDSLIEKLTKYQKREQLKLL